MLKLLWNNKQMKTRNKLQLLLNTKQMKNGNNFQLLLKKTLFY